MISVRSFVCSALVAASAWPAAAAAQERRPEARPRIYVGSGDDTTVMRNRVKLVTTRRARLGVTVNLQASDNDSIGATIQSVTPGGPAAKAGIKSGDIIARLEGKNLVASDGKKTGEDESVPGLRLVEIASQLKPNQTISVEYRRDGVRKTTSLVTGDEPMMEYEFFSGDPDHFVLPKMRVEGRMLPRSGGGGVQWGPEGGSGFFSFGGPLMDLELAPLNSDLGQYFGTTEGVLVIDVPKESTLGLKGGDVILSVDGRKASGPSSLLRILRSYEPGDSFKLEIMRNKSRTTVTGKLEKPKDE
jgi:S1-C subfamily serine protease